MNETILHIGTLKTGTTSFQKWFSDNEVHLRDKHNVALFRGQWPDSRELAAICINDNRDTPATALNFFPARGSADWQSWSANIAADISRQQAEAHARGNRFVVSSEALCLLRRPEEISRLTELFGAADVTIIVTLRYPKDFLSSWKQHLNHDFFKRSKDKTSFAYVKRDSWLVDYEQLLMAYRNQFGRHKVHVISYDEALQLEGSVIPALARECIGTADDLPQWSSYMLNRSKRPPRPPIKGMARPRHYARYYLWKARKKLTQKRE